MDIGPPTAVVSIRTQELEDLAVRICECVKLAFVDSVTAVELQILFPSATYVR